MYTSAPLTFDDFYNSSLRRNSADFGEAAGSVRTAQEMALLEATFAKSLTATTGLTPVAGTTGGDAIKDVTLRNTLAVTERRMETEAPLWTRLKKVPHPYDRIEWAKLDSFGGDEYGSVLNTNLMDGGLTPRDPDLGRVTTPMGWFGDMALTTLMLNTQRTVGFDGIAVGNSQDVAAKSNLNSLVLDLDRHVLWGNRDVNPFQCNGLIKQTRAVHNPNRETRVNLKGRPLSRETAQHIEAILREKGAMWSEFWLPGYSRADFVGQFIDAIRIGSGVNLAAGNQIDEYLISKWNGKPGKAEILTDNHLRARRIPTRSTGGMIAPAAITAAQSANPNGNVWGENLTAGVRSYKVVARGINGTSLPSNPVSIVVTAGNSVSLTITKNDAATIEYEVYAVANATGAGAGFIGRVGAYGTPVASTVSFTDDGEFIPGCDTGLILANGALEDGQDEVQIVQQFPITRVDLPRYLLGFPQAWVAAMTPMDYTPGYNLILENVGRTDLVASV